MTVQDFHHRVTKNTEVALRKSEISTCTLKEVPDVAIYQLHRNVTTTANAPADYVANDKEFCRGEFIKLSVAPGGKSYTVSVPAKRISRQYQVR